MLKFYILFCIVCSCLCLESSFMGCYKDTSPVGTRPLNQYHSEELCIKNCRKLFYRYSNFHEGNCVCANYLGQQVANTTCSEYCVSNSCSFTDNLTDVYYTGNLVPGPPRNFIVDNVTETTCHVLWQEPESYVDIAAYVLKAVVLRTFSSYSPNSPEWTYNNNTFQTEIITLLSATDYNITLSVETSSGYRNTVFKKITTKLAGPDSPPPQPKILNNDGSQMTVQLMPATNNNGPISAYRIIVVNADDKQGFEQQDVLSYDDAVKNSLSYYVAAEVDPNGITKDFVVGDGKRYGRFSNPPLIPGVNYNIIVGLVSHFNGETKIAYSEASGSENGVLILDVNEVVSGDTPGVIIGLSVAICLLSFMLIAGIIGFAILKSKIISRRQRLSDNQELTLQGPMIEVENNGYIYEEDHIPAVTHYRNLKQKVRTISPTELKIEPTNLLGVGKFGRVNSGTLNENGNLTTIAAYSIQDKKMGQDTKKAMLQELDVLIKIGKHDNIVNLIGTSENPQMVIVVLEYTSMNLKDLLLGSRDALPGRFSSMTEKQALEIAIGVCKGMAHLHSNNIIHKQLCTRSVMISNGFMPKIGSYGIAQYFTHNKIPDYTRWTAIEVFKGRPHNSKSDIWSFGCLLWEICALGGTPYGNVDNNEIPEKIMKGLRLPQLQYIADELYQLLLDCWQIDCDERPKFTDLTEHLKQGLVVPFLSFCVFRNFQYEQFYPDMELAVRPVF